MSYKMKFILQNVIFTLNRSLSNKDGSLFSFYENLGLLFQFVRQNLPNRLLYFHFNFDKIKIEKHLLHFHKVKMKTRSNKMVRSISLLFCV